MNTLAPSSDLIFVAQIAGGHGVQGALKIQSFFENQEDFKLYSPFLDNTGKKYFFKVLSVTPKHVLARLEDVHTRTEADNLKGLKLYIPREALKSLPEEEFYLHDLLACKVLNSAHEDMGILEHIHNYGAQDILEITLKDGASVLVPFQKEIVLDVSPHPSEQGKGFIVLDKAYLENLRTSFASKKS